MPQSSTSSFAGIFICYRSKDCAIHAGRLFDNLREHFGPEHVFIDLERLEPGEVFSKVIENAVGSCAVLIAVIGSDWLSIGEAKSWKDNAKDFIRLEIGTALRREIAVIPVLVRGANMPTADQLPKELENLPGRHSFELSDRRWSRDVDDLIAYLEKILGKPKSTTSEQAPPPLSAVQPAADNASRAEPVPDRAATVYIPSKKRTVLLIAGAAAFVLIALAQYFLLQRAPQTERKDLPSASPSVTPAERLSADEAGARGKAALDQQRYAEAEPYYRQAVELDAFTPSYFDGLGVALFFQQKYADAEAPFRRAQALQPNNPIANDSVGNVLAKLARYAEAEPFHRAASRLRPHNAEYANNLGIDLYFQQKYDAAEQAFRLAARLNPDHAIYQHDLGNALYKQGKYAAAASAYRRSVQMRPKDAGFHNDLGNALFELRKYAEAKREFNEALGLDSSNLEYRENVNRAPK